MSRGPRPHRPGAAARSDELAAQQQRIDLRRHQGEIGFSAPAKLVPRPEAASTALFNSVGAGRLPSAAPRGEGAAQTFHRRVLRKAIAAGSPGAILAHGCRTAH
jgi:hypothetical protein